MGTDSQSMIDCLYVAGGGDTPKAIRKPGCNGRRVGPPGENSRGTKGIDRSGIIYVKGHQDDRVSYNRLPLMAQLNVDADCLANKFQQEHGAQRPFSLMVPNAGAFLVTENGTLTSNFSSELRSRSTGPGLEEYIRSKNDWDHCTFEQVNWKVHGKAVKELRPRRVHLTKFLNDALLTFHHAKNLMDGGTRKCIVGCGCCDETADHIFRCTAQSREQ